MSGCRCSQCYGFREWAIENGVRHEGLPPAPGHGGRAQLSAVEAIDDPCTGDMTCRCSSCQAQVAALVKRGPRGSGTQPWNVRGDRRAAA